MADAWDALGTIDIFGLVADGLDLVEERGGRSTEFLIRGYGR